MAEIVVVSGMKALQHVDCSTSHEVKPSAEIDTTAFESITFEVMINNDGDYAIVLDGEDAEDKWNEDNVFSPCMATYIINLKIPLPKFRTIDVDVKHKVTGGVSVFVNEKSE